MGFFSTLKTIVNIATLGGVTQIEIGGKLVEVLVDANNQLVRVGAEIFRAIPGEVLFPGLGPLAGVLKNEVEDELILLSPLGLVPSLTIFVDGQLVVGKLIGAVQHRGLLNAERAIVQRAFGGALGPLDDIRLTNLGGLLGRAFTAPSLGGGSVVNLAKHYIHDLPVNDMGVLIHELTHVWQIQRALLPEIFLCTGALVQLINEFESQYDYTPGKQWSEYNLEQQAHIVEDWVRRAPSPAGGMEDVSMKLGSPLFRYVNGNVRPGSNDAGTETGGTVRTRLAEAKVGSLSVRRINPPRRRAFWPVEKDEQHFRTPGLH